MSHPRVRELLNKSLTVAWDLTPIGIDYTIPAGGTSDYDIAPYFTDSDITDLLQRGELVLSSDNVLVVDDGAASTTEYDDSNRFGNVTQNTITDFENSPHDHEDAKGGGQLVGADALSDASNAGGNDKVVLTTGAGNIDLGADQEIFGLTATPTLDDSAASKAYVDSVASGLDTKEAVYVATAGALPSYNKTGTGVGAFLQATTNGALTVDTTLLTAGDVGKRVLVKDENGGAADVDHGIYVITHQGDISTPWKLTRASDFDQDAEVTSGAFTFVVNGGVNEGTGWTVSTNDPIQIDVTAIQWTQFSGAGVITAGTGLTKDGNTIHVGDGTVEVRGGIDFQANDLAVSTTTASSAQANGGLQINGGDGKLEAITDNSTLEVSDSNALRVKDDGITGEKLAAAVAGDGIKQDGSGNLNIEPADFAGNGLQDDGTDDLEVKVDTATGGNVSQALSVTSDGVGVKIDNDTIQENGSNQLYVENAPDKGQKMWVTFGEDGTTGDNTYLKLADVRTNKSGLRVLRACRVTGISCQLSQAAPSGGVTIELKKRDGDGGSIVTLNDTALSVSATDFGNQATGLTNALSAGEELIVKTSNSNDIKNPVVTVELELT